MRRRSILISLTVLAGLLLFALAGFFRPVRETFKGVLLPIARAASDTGEGLGRFFRLSPEARVANERADELEARLRSSVVDYVRLRALEEENRSLLAQAKFITERGFQTLGARIISRAITERTAAVTIDRGKRDGVEAGDAVVTEDGIFIGKVIETGERTATVMLVSDMNSRTAAKTVGSTRISGVIEGKGNGVARFTLIPQSVPLKRDDVVVTAGTEERIPGNLAIGLVNDVESKPTDPFKNAAIEPLAPLVRLELVSVIIPGSQE